MNKEKKLYFPNWKKWGINSFVVRNIQSRDMLMKINLLHNECLNRLHNGPASTIKKNNISLAIESPKFCINYAEWNIDRKVPLRQYFGLNNGNNDNNDSITKRWCYGVGSGSSTVGGDMKTTQTKPMTTVMKDLCKILSNFKMLKCKGEFCEKKVNFNHVTILYYMNDSKSNKKITLNPHCDVGISASNVYLTNNSQKEGTPTVVLSLSEGKPISFYKRYSNGKKFVSEAGLVDKLDMKHGDLFVLHPLDERVINRRIHDGEKFKIESEKTQFKHGVECIWDRKKRENDVHQTSSLLSISVCFRESIICQNFSQYKNITVDEKGLEYDNDIRTQQMKARNINIEKKRKEIQNSNNLKRIQKKTRRFVRDNEHNNNPNKRSRIT